jgi:pimeloyl-ACP methyl ester carboxylesterase
LRNTKLVSGAAVVALGLLLLGTTPVATAAQPVVAAPPRPGPDVLYRPAPRAPQLENTGVWKAAPLLVSGASAYRSGEFLYQDFLYDDQGAGNNYSYPTVQRLYEQNAADLLELRVRPLADATAIRITYNTMRDPKLVGTTIALGDSDAAQPMPHGANASTPAKVFVTAHGATGDIVDAATGTTLATKPAVRVDLLRRQVEVRVPYSVFDPRGQSNVRVAAASGLWDVAAGQYLAPVPGPATTAAPGGAVGPLPAAFFNIGFRYDEPEVLPTGNLITNNWRTSNQSTALASGDISQFFATVDFSKLAAGTNDATGVPTTGFMNRIYASHFELAQGKQTSAAGLAHTDDPAQCTACVPVYSGQLQPYSLYVPEKAPPATGYGITFELHGAGGNYNAYFGSRNDRALGERGTGSLVAIPNGRSPSSWYYGQGQSEVFEIWAALARTYKIDFGYAAVTGGSMGAYGTFKTAAMYPDLFARMAPITGCPTENGSGEKGTPVLPGSRIINVAASYRNVPINEYDAAQEEICNNGGVEEQFVAAVQAAGYRINWHRFTGDHVTTGSLDNFPGLVEWMGNGRVDPNPPHVTYVVNEHFAEPRYTLTVDHAYWLSGLKLRNPTVETSTGTIDVRSHGFGRGDPPAIRKPDTNGVLTDGAVLPATTYSSQIQEWGPAPATPVKDQLDIKATNIRTVAIDTKRARVSCNAKLNITSDGPLTVNLLGCARSLAAPPAAGGSLPATGAAVWPPALGAFALLTGVALRARRRARATVQ